MRTFEELEKDNYENLTYGELCEYDLGCKCCPLSINGQCDCNGGMKCYGNMPIEPPCCGFEEDDILQNISDSWFRTQQLDEKIEKELKAKELKAKEIKEKQSKLRKQKLQEYKSRNLLDLIEIKKLNKNIKYNKKHIIYLQKLNTYTNSVNLVNQMFRECNFSCPSDINNNSLKDKIELYKQNIENYTNQILSIKNKIKKSEKEFKKGIE